MRACSFSMLLEADFEAVPQGTADEVEGHNDKDEHHESGVDLPPAAAREEASALGQHPAPGGRGRRQGNAEVLEHSRDQDGVGDLERRIDDDRADQRWELCGAK